MAVDYCSQCDRLKGHGTDARGLCVRHGLPVRGAWHDPEEPYIELESHEDEAIARDCECRAVRDKAGYVQVYLCEEHLRAPGTLKVLEPILHESGDQFENHNDMIKRAQKLEEIEGCALRADEELRSLALEGVADDADIDDVAEAAVKIVTDSEDFEGAAAVADVLIEACGMTWDDWAGGKDPWLRAKFDPVAFLVERLRKLAPEKLAENAGPLTSSGKRYAPGYTREAAEYEERSKLVAPDFTADLRKRVEQLEKTSEAHGYRLDGIGDSLVRLERAATEAKRSPRRKADPK